MTSKYTIYYINLDRAPERAAFMDTQLSKLGLSPFTQRVAAVDALDQKNESAYEQQKRTSRWMMLESEIAIFESHRKIWKRIVKNQQAHTVILEDDVFLSNDLRKTIDTVLSSISKYDVVKLDGFDLPKVLFGSGIHLNGLTVRPILSAVGSAACYLVSLSGAQKLLDQSSTYCDVVDDFLFEPRVNWSALQVEPAVGVQGMFLNAKYTNAFPKAVSQSERTQIQSINGKRTKGPLSYRVKKEFLRLAKKIFMKYLGKQLLLNNSGKIGPITLAPDLGKYNSVSAKICQSKPLYHLK